MQYISARLWKRLMLFLVWPTCSAVCIRAQALVYLYICWLERKNTSVPKLAAALFVDDSRRSLLLTSAIWSCDFQKLSITVQSLRHPIISMQSGNKDIQIRSWCTGTWIPCSDYHLSDFYTSDLKKNRCWTKGGIQRYNIRSVGV